MMLLKKKATAPSVKYHAAILVTAAGILIAGGVWRGGREVGEPRSEAALIEELRREVSGIRFSLSGSELDAISQRMSDAARPVGRAVVSIRPIQGVQTLRVIPHYGDLVNQPGGPPSSAGLSPGLSGVVLDRNGYVLTSASAGVLGARVQLTFADGVQQEAELVGTDTVAFIAVLKMQSVPSTLAAADFSQTRREFRPGEWVIRLGRSPTGRESLSLCLLESVRLGAGSRTVGFLNSAAPPEADGALVIDATGRIAGVYLSPPQAPAFVLPIDDALSVVNRIRTAPQRTPTSAIGIEFQDITEDLREFFHVRGGAIVTSVLAGGPADRAGVNVGDVVRTIDEGEVASAVALAAEISGKAPGAVIKLGVQRNARDRVVSVVSTAYPIDQAAAVEEPPALAVKVEDAGAGPVIVNIGPAALANRLGLLTGDVILAINGRRVRRAAELVRIASMPPNDGPRLLLVERGGRSFFIAVRERMNIDE